MKYELVCITCPIGCRLEAERLPDGSLRVTGNLCPRGAKYAEDEILDPRRVVTATCRTDSAEQPRLPVRSEAPVPKDRIPELLAAIYALEVRLPVEAGEAVLPDFHGIRVVATSTLRELDSRKETAKARRTAKNMKGENQRENGSSFS